MALWSFLKGWTSRGTGAPDLEQRKYDAYTSAWLGDRGAKVGATVDQVLSNSAVAVRCIAIRSELLASVPLFLFKRTDDGGRERADENPLYHVLHDSPNGWQTAFEFREQMIRSLDLHGNAFAVIVRNGRGEVVELHPLAARSMDVERLSNGRLRYKYSDERGGTTVYLQDEILHLRGPSKDGLMGQSPISLARGSLGLAIAQEETARTLATSGMRIGGFLMHPARLGQEATKNIADSFEQKHSGPRKAGKISVLEEGMKFQPAVFSPEDSELLSSRKLSNEDVARIFGVPPTACGILDRGTYSNVEQEQASLIAHCIGPLAARLEAGLQRSLLTANGRRTMYVEHDLAGLLRGDVASRFNAYRVAREIGALSANDIRRLENQPPIPNGNQYHMPANWIELGSQPAQPAENANA